VGEGAEVDGAVVLAESGEGEAGDGVVEVDLEQEEPFVVAEIDVEPGLELLDQFAFEQEGLGLGLHDVPVEVVDGLDEGVELEVPAQAAGGLEVGADPFAQVAGLADVDDAAEAVLVQVDTRFVGCLGELVTNDLVDRHGGGVTDDRGRVTEHGR
jgi:hypothetical protein